MKQNNIVIIVLIIFCLLFGAYFFKTNKLSKSVTTSISPTPSYNPSPETKDWKTYIDASYGYSFKYPADYKPYVLNGNNFYSSDAQFDKITTLKTKGLEIGSTVFSPGENIPAYNGLGTQKDSSFLAKLVLPPGYVANAYVNTEDVEITIDYTKNNEKKKLFLWCGGENGNSDSCKKVLIPLLSTFKFKIW